MPPENSRLPDADSVIPRREFVVASFATSAAAFLGYPRFGFGQQPAKGPAIRTVLGPIPAERLGPTLMHEHAPLVDWSELYEVPVGPVSTRRNEMLTKSAALLNAFQTSVKHLQGQPAIVECTPIRVGRYPDLLVELAKQASVHIIACTGFWCEAMAPQHPWALRLMAEPNGVRRLAELYIREIEQGMEDPHGQWGQRFTNVKAGIIKCATSTWMRPSERKCHEAAAIASRETGCPITTHTTDGGGLEQAELFLKHKVRPEKIIIGHQGNLDDRSTEEAHEYHRRIAGLGCYVQFDRVGHAEKYANEKLARQIRALVDSGHRNRVLLAHDHVPYFYTNYAAEQKTGDGWKHTESDFTVASTELVAALKQAGVTEQDVDAMLVENPRRVLAF